MISKRIGIAPKNDNYARLAAYIADAGHEGEKSLMNWCAGCLGGEEYAEGIAEVMDTQDKNSRAGTKTYHLVVSFRPEDEAKLTPDMFKAMEERFAKALGWSEHQRHCGVHKNTGNLHMHMAYNMVHPEKYTRHKEFRDFWIRDKVCRELEREYGLSVDNGRGHAAPGKQRQGEKAALVEAHTGQQSFESYAKAHREAILQTQETATAWQQLHETLASHGMEIKPHGNGLVVKDRHSEHAIKASTLDRSLSQKKLEARLGPYLPPHGLEQAKEKSCYESTPLSRSPERGNLFAEYRVGIESRKATLQAVKEQEDAALAAIRAEWAAKRRELERMNIAKRNRRNLLQLAKKHETEALAKAKLAFQEPREAVRLETPYTSWNGFLRHKAEQGSEVALAILRSNTEVVEPEQPTAPAKDWSTHGQDYTAKTISRVEQAEKERAVLEMNGVSGRGKTRLQAVLRMEQVAATQGLQIAHRVDGKGAVVFTLPGGGTVRDCGKELFFTTQDKTAEAVAKGYAQKKWGKSLRLEGNHICREPNLEGTKEKRQGVER